MHQFNTSRDNLTEIEQVRAYQRQLRRTRQQLSLSHTKVENLDDDDGRRRKMRQKQHQVAERQPSLTFPTPFEALYHKPCAVVSTETQYMTDVGRQVASMGFHCTGMW